MKKKNLINVLFILVCVGSLFGFFLINFLLSLFLCEEFIRAEVYSSDKRFSAQTIELGCNATVGFITEVKLIDSKDPFIYLKRIFKKSLPGYYAYYFNDQDTLLILSGKQLPSVKWLDNKTLIIENFKNEGVRNKKTYLYGIKVIYNKKF